MTLTGTIARDPGIDPKNPTGAQAGRPDPTEASAQTNGFPKAIVAGHLPCPPNSGEHV
jgi:hypothetical protein